MDQNRERIGRVLDALTTGLFPFVERELKSAYRENWHTAAAESFRRGRGGGAGGSTGEGETIRWDAHTLLTVIWDQWNNVFRKTLGQFERNIVSELREYRNRWAHQAEFEFDDAYRLLDSAERLLSAAGAEDWARQVARDKRELLREEFGREARAAYRRAQIRRRNMQELGVYLLCCAAGVFAVLQAFGPRAWFVAVFIGLVFAYLAFQRLTSPPPVYLSAHECETCRRIIYSEECPYCEPGLDVRRA
ncbi:MAG TPA: Swt1 family HEPN domain-containing protein [Planctomycetaceae bacterium]|nr:Swt1 family HEPN domain-containing protein [Planctomycetaceae bacterium]